MDKDRFFESMASQGLALTFLDVRLRTAPSTVAAPDISLDSRFSRNVPLKTPIASAAMDTVTTAEMAIEMAKLGGIGVIHAGLSPRDQAREVKRVKYHLNGLIDNPITITPHETLAQVQEMRSSKGYKFHSLPVVDAKGKLVGLMTRNDFAFSRDLGRPVSSVMTPASELVTAPDTTSIKEAYDIMVARKKKTLPLVDKSGVVTGLYVFTDVARIIQGSSSTHNVDGNGRLRVAAAVPTDEEALERIELMHDKVDVIVIDTARGDGRPALDTLKAIKKKYSKLDVVVGNISEGESARLLAKAGADGIKVGQGGGSICTTRVETGIGCPQVTAVYECAKAVRGMDVPVCADGGISDPGDISIAIAAGGDSVMLGRLLAGTKETPGEVVMDKGNLVKMYRGMGSAAAMRESQASRRRYGQVAGQAPLPEGVESYVPYKGPVADVMYHYVGSLRKSLQYCGAADIAAHHKTTGFHRITNAGVRESRPHDVSVISRAPGYSDDLD